MSNLNNSVREGALWSYIGQFYMTAGQFLFGVVLARLLGPEEFGVFIAVTAFTSLILIIIQFGMPITLVQAEEVTSDEADSAFWMLMALGLVGFAVIVSARVILGELFGAKDFATVMLAMSTVFFLVPFTSVATAMLRRQMRFRAVARIQMRAFTASSLASLCCAFVGFGVYSLVVGAVVNMLSTGVQLVSTGVWRPGKIKFKPISRLLGASGFFTTGSMLNALTNRVDNMLVGALMGVTSLGLYNRAFSLSRLPADQFSESLAPLLLGSLARLQEDSDSARALFAKAACIIALVTLPFVIFLGVAGPILVLFLYGDQWAGAGPALQVMALGGVFLALSVPMRSLVNAQGLARQMAWIHFVALLATVGFVLALFPLGLVAISVGITLKEGVRLAMLLRLAARGPVDVRPGEFFYFVAPSLIAGGGAGVGGMAMLLWSSTQGIGSFVALATTFAVVFFLHGVLTLGMMVVWRGHSPLQWAKALLVETTTRALLARRWPSLRGS
jgi:PST family polysaccharide transporter